MREIDNNVQYILASVSEHLGDIDKQNIDYIRSHYDKNDTMSDNNALLEYINDKPLEYEHARYHNKYPNGWTYKDYVKDNNRKRAYDFHTEFILDKNGRF